MIEKIIPDRISLTLPTVFGEELTFLEFCGKLRAKLNECIDGVNGNSSNIEGLTLKTNENTANIQQNTANIQQNASAISKNESDIVKLNGVVNSVSAQTDDNTVNINTVSGKVDKNTADIQQNTSAISADEAKMAALTTAFNDLRSDFLNKKVESLFAPVILNVENHVFGADINASVYVRLGRIDWQGLGCLYAKINLSFSGATDAKTLKINSVQFGDRKAADITSVSTSFTAKTDVINLPISIVGTSDIPVGTSDIAVTGVNLLGMSTVASSLASSFALDSIPTGIDIPCESLTFTSPGGSEQSPKLVYTLKVVEGGLDIFAVAAGLPAISERAYMYTNFADIISNTKIFTQFLCSGGLYTDDTLSSVPDNGAALGAALINYLEDGTTGGEIYTARTTLTTEHNGGSTNSLNKTGNASMNIPFGQAAHISLRFDLFN